MTSGVQLISRRFSDKVESGLPRATQIVAAAADVAKSIQDDRAMAKLPPNMPNLAALAGAHAKLRHGIEARAAKSITKIEGVDAHADATFEKYNASIDNHDGGLVAIDDYLTDLDKQLGNGAPEGSKESSDGSQGDGPAKS